MARWTKLFRNLFLIGVLVAAGASTPQPAQATDCEWIVGGGLLAPLNGCIVCESENCTTYTCPYGVFGSCG